MKKMTVGQILEARGENIVFVIEKWDEEDNIVVLFDEAEAWERYAEDIPTTFDKMAVKWFYIKERENACGDTVIALVVE